MSELLRGILQQKLLEIQSQLPPFVKLIKDAPAADNFEQVLSGELSSAGGSSTDYSSVYGTGKPSDYDEIIDAAARKYNISPSIIKAVIRAESGFNTNAMSGVGAMGLMQLMPSTARGLGVTNAFDPRQNIDAGVRYLKGLLQEFGGNLELALAAYNAGPNNVKKYGGIPPFEETQNYVKRIMGYLRG